MKYRFITTTFGALTLLIAVLGTAIGQTLTQEQISQLKFRHIGPVGNRLTCTVGVPGNDLVYYAGAASGGVWKTEDGGLNWKPIFDKQTAHSIGALAVASSDTEIVWAGTGESSIRSNVSIGNGVYKSMDGGETWKNMGLDNSGRVSRIIIHPTNPDIVYVAAVGHAYTPQKDRGVYKTSDGGKTWKQVLYVDDNTGASDIVMDPSNPRILFAGMWHLELKTWKRVSGGPGSGLYMSKDAGETWKKLDDKGLPKKYVGKIALAMSAANPNRVYAIIETGDGAPVNGEATESGELWRSEDKGKTWKLINHNRDISGRQAYYTRISVTPDNPNEVFFVTYRISKSLDGGVSLINIPFPNQPNWDHHDMWIDPTNGNRMAVAGDGGISISKNRGAAWYRIQLPVAQLYHVTTDSNVPYFVLTNRQDGPSMRGPSRNNVGSLFGPGSITTGEWFAVGGGESGFATADPTNPDLVWSSASGYGPLGGMVTVYNVKNRQFRQVEVWPEFTPGHPAKDVKYRFQWTFPLLISPHDNNTVYVTSQFVHRTTNKGQSWEIISPDLTLDDESKQQPSGGLTPDNIAVEYANVIYAFDESPVQKGVLWAGTNDGLVHVSQDNGVTWLNVTSNIKDLPSLGVVRNIEASKYSAGKAYMTIEFHQVGNFKPYVYKTENFGKTWRKITSGIDNNNLNYSRMIKEDPVRPGLLYLGTESKLYISFDDGGKWQPFMSNLPPTPMYWIDVQEHFNDMVVGTYGRGIWILDDISALQQLPADVASQKALLFDLKDAYRFRPRTGSMQFFPEPSTGKNPPFGSALNFWLSEKTDSVKLHITNAAGDTVKTITHKGVAGINRAWWNYMGEPTEKIAFERQPQYVNWMDPEKSKKRKDGLSFSIMVPPGVYTITMVAGEITASKSLKIVKDPHSDGAIADIEKQYTFLSKLYEDANTVATMVNNVESVRSQLASLKSVLGKKEGLGDLMKSIASLDSTVVAWEGEMVQLKHTGTGQDDVRWPARLAEKIAYLAGNASVGDFPPTDQQEEVYAVLSTHLAGQKAAWNDIVSGPYAELMNLLKENDIGPIVVDFE